jgi:septal ring factor EnvC (AmiA/AmiB activator)
MPIHKGLFCTAEELKRIRELQSLLAEPLPNVNGEKFARFFEERQQAKDQLKTLLASLRPPTVEELAVEIERLQTKLAQIEAKIAEDVRAKREKRELAKRDGQRKV